MGWNIPRTNGVQMMAARHSPALNAGTAAQAASDIFHPTPPVRPRYTGRVPAWAWITVFGLLIAAILPVLRTSSVTESSSELFALEAERDRLQTEIRSLSAHVGQLGSLARVRQQAEERLNMVAVRPTVVLDVDQPPPARTMPSRFLLPADSAEPSSADTSPSFWDTLFDTLILD